MKARDLSKNKKKLFNIINKDQDWDYSYIYKLLRVKLENIRYYAENYTVALQEKWRIPWIIRAINLLKILETEEVPENFKVNLNNYKRFGCEAVWLYKCIELRQKRPNNFIEINVGDFPIKTIDMLNSDLKNFYIIKSKHLLFNILANYINNWWD